MEVIDRTARESAAEAHRRMDDVVNAMTELATATAVTARGLTDHEVKCVEARDRDAVNSGKIEKAINGLYGRWWWVMCTLIVGMAGFIGTLIVLLVNLKQF